MSLIVDDVAASAALLTVPFGFRVQASHGGDFAKLVRDGGGLDVVFLRYAGNELLPKPRYPRAA